MALSRDSRNEAKLKAFLRHDFRLKQALERIDFEHDVVAPKILEFQGKAQLPELPAPKVLTIEWEDESAPPKRRSRAPRTGK